MRLIIAAAAVGLILSVEPSPRLQAQEPTPARLNVREAWRTTGEDLPTGPFGAIAGMAALDDGTVWISDAMSETIVALKPDGAAKGLVARSGDGPGEVRGPRLFARDSEELAVYDIARGSIDVFGTTDGDFRRRIQLLAHVTWVKGFAVLPGGEYVLSGGLPGSRQAIHRFDDSGHRLEAWDRTPDTENWMAAVVVAGGPLQSMEDGSLLFSRAAPHEIIRYRRLPNGSYDQQGVTLARQPELLKAVADDAIVTTYDGGVRIQGFRAFPRSIGVFILSNGSVLNVIVYYDQKRTLFQLYDPTVRRLLDSQAVPRAYKAWHLTPSNDLLVSYRDSATDESVAALLRIF